MTAPIREQRSTTSWRLSIKPGTRRPGNRLTAYAGLDIEGNKLEKAHAHAVAAGDGKCRAPGTLRECASVCRGQSAHFAACRSTLTCALGCYVQSTAAQLLPKTGAGKPSHRREERMSTTSLTRRTVSKADAPTPPAFVASLTAPFVHSVFAAGTLSVGTWPLGPGSQPSPAADMPAIGGQQGRSRLY